MKTWKDKKMITSIHIYYKTLKITYKNLNQPELKKNIYKVAELSQADATDLMLAL